jgi:hypothetical protein
MVRTIILSGSVTAGSSLVRSAAAAADGDIITAGYLLISFLHYRLRNEECFNISIFRQHLHIIFFCSYATIMNA